MARTDRAPRRRLDPDARRASITEAAANAFAASPYAEVSLAAISREAEASESLVHKYFATKADLYAVVVQAAFDELRDQQEEADAALPPNTSVRDRVRVWLLVYLDHVAAHPTGWAAPFMFTGNEPDQAVEVRRLAGAAYVESLAALLTPDPTPRRRFALWGFFGFLDAACLAWVEQGCPDAERHSLVEAVLGALEGAIGDWGR